MAIMTFDAERDIKEIDDATATAQNYDNAVADSARISTYWQDGTIYEVPVTPEFKYFSFQTYNRAGQLKKPKIVLGLKLGEQWLYMTSMFRQVNGTDGKAMVYEDNTLNKALRDARSAATAPFTNVAIKDAIRAFCAGKKLVVSHKDAKGYENRDTAVVVFTLVP